MLWDDRFHLGRLPLYHATRDPHLRRHTSLPRLRITSRTQHRSPSPNSLRQDLEALWAKEAVPAWHREAYTAYLNTLPPAVVGTILRKEVGDLQVKRSLIQTILAAIQLREELLVLLQTDRSLSLLQQLQSTSVDVVEGICTWRQTLGPKSFLYAGENYLLKMKTDIPQDPMLVRALRKYGSTIRARAQDAELVIAQELQPYLPSETPLFPIPNPCIPTIVDQSTLSGTYSPPNAVMLSLPSLLLEDLISLLINQYTPLICTKMCRAYIRAHLLLYTNTLLEGIIAATLREEIHTCAQEAYTEETDKEYIAFQQEIVDKVVISEVESGVRQWTNEEIAYLIGGQYISLVDITDLVLESIQEEQSLNTNIIICTYSNILEAYISQDWLEILCEDCISEELLALQLDRLPYHIQHKVLRGNLGKYQERVAEWYYASLLHQYVGEIWCRKVVEETILEARGERPKEDVFSVGPERRSIRRQTRVRNAS